jgi:TrmH family RNA methyltransferase
MHSKNVNLLKNPRELAIRIVFVEPEDEGNIGLLARTMKNFNVKDLYLVNPKACPKADFAERLAAHGLDVLKEAKTVENLEEAIKDVDLTIGTTAKKAADLKNIRRSSVTPSQLVKNLTRMTGKAAILFGRESIGLTNDELEKCDFIVTIPANPFYSTLNVTHAAAIILYEIFKRRKIPSLPVAKSEEKRRLLTYFRQALEESGFPQHKIRKAVRALKNIMGRALTTRREIQVLIGAFRKIELALQRENK